MIDLQSQIVLFVYLSLIQYNQYNSYLHKFKIRN